MYLGVSKDKNKTREDKTMMKQTLYSTNLSSMPYAQAHVNYNDDGSVDMYSYTTRVVSVDREGWLECTGLYSATTRKHIGAFMRNEVRKMCGYNLDYHTAKSAYENGYRLNIHTGEVKD